MADDHLFLLPVVIDDTDQAVARVPEKFLTVQWLKVPGGRPTRALEALCSRVVRGNVTDAKPSRARNRAGKSKSAAVKPLSPEFPKAEPGQKIKFWVDVLAWAVRSAWVLFRRLPRWMRILLSLWIAITLVSRCESSRHERSAAVSPAKVEKLKAISEKYQGSLTKNDIINLGTQIAKEFSDDTNSNAADGGPLLAIPFTAPAGDAAAAKLADATFAMTYGRLSISHQGQVSLSKDPLPSRELGAALERGRASHATYVLCGTVDAVGVAQALTVRVAAVGNGSVVWSKTYPVTGADPAKIAAEVESKIPALAPN